MPKTLHTVHIIVVCRNPGIGVQRLAEIASLRCDALSSVGRSG